MSLRPLILSSDTAAPVQVVDAPRTDYIELAARLGADIAYAIRSGLMDRLERATALDLRQAARAARRSDVSLFFSLSEKVALPLALLPKRSRVPHVLIAHYLTSPKKRALQKRTGYLFRFDSIIVLCRFQERYLLDEVGLPPERVRRVWDKVDRRFWTPGMPAGGGTAAEILSVGRERRDYETLLDVARTLPDLTFTVVASSPWSKGTDKTGHDIPANVCLERGLSWLDLRERYRRASLVVVPLQAGCEYAAGVNAVLEAQAMQKPLIVSQTPGIADYVEDNVTGIWCPAANHDALRDCIVRLQNDTVAQARLGANARNVVDGGRNLDGYLDALTEVAVAAAPALTPLPAREKEPLVA